MNCTTQPSDVSQPSWEFGGTNEAQLLLEVQSASRHDGGTDWRNGQCWVSHKGIYEATTTSRAGGCIQPAIGSWTKKWDCAAGVERSGTSTRVGIYVRKGRTVG